MKFTAQQIAGILEGDVVGDPDVEVSKLSKIEEGFTGSLTFLANPKYTPFIYNTEASITIVNKTFVPENQVKTTLIKVDDAYLAFSKILSGPLLLIFVTFPFLSITNRTYTLPIN